MLVPPWAARTLTKTADTPESVQFSSGGNVPPEASPSKRKEPARDPVTLVRQKVIISMRVRVVWRRVPGPFAKCQAVYCSA